jgi:hypothetical protein
MRAVSRGLAIHGFRSIDDKPFSPSNPFYESSAWLNAFNKDETVLNMKSLDSQEENFKWMAVLAMVDAQMPGNGKHVVPEIYKVKSQINAIQQNVVDNALILGNEVRCDARPRNQHYW